MILRWLLFFAAIAWGVQFIVRREWWTDWIREHHGFVRNEWLRTETHYRNFWWIGASVSFIWAIAVLLLGP